MHTPTVHNPTNFDPASYEVLDYLDGNRPAFFGQPKDAYETEVKFWEADNLKYFGTTWPVRKCVHCGHNPLRWLTIVKHLPTGDVVVFGADCTARLHFEDRKTFKLAQLQARDAANKVRIKVWNARTAFLAARPEFAEAILTINEPAHAKNTFVHDVVAKLGQYGSLSDRQVNGVLASLKRDVEYAAKKATEVVEVKGDAPTGRVTVTGQVVSVKGYENAFGFSLKMTLKLENGSRVWLTAPSKETIERGDVVTVSATFTVSNDDKSFGFGKRPVLISRTPAPVAVAS